MSISWPSSFVAVLVRPLLWRTALVQARRLAGRGWWRRWPPVPAPPEGYLRFRLETMYGTGHEATAADLVTYLEWCREIDRR